MPGENLVAIIANLGKRLFLVSLSETLTIGADGNSSDKHIPLTDGSIIHIGDEQLVIGLAKDLIITKDFKFLPDSKDQSMKLMHIEESGYPGESYVLPSSGRTITIGRNSAQCFIGISNNSQISRVHFQGIIHDKYLIIVDNNTTNGTFVNNKRIRKRKCFPGDIICFGDVKFFLCYVV